MGNSLKVPLSVLVSQIRYKRGVVLDSPYSVIMEATGITPTVVQLIGLGRAKSKAAVKRYLKSLKRQAEDAYAEAVARDNKREAQEIRF